MKIAVPYDTGLVFQHFGHTEQFMLYTVENGVITGTELCPTAGQGHGALAGFLTGKGAQVLICGGLGMGARQAVTAAGIKLFPGVSGSADAAVQAYLAGTLAFDPNTTCDHHHHDEGEGCDHHHEEGEGCGHHHEEGHTCGHCGH